MEDRAFLIKIENISEKNYKIIINILIGKGYKKPTELKGDKDCLIFYTFKKRTELIKFNRLEELHNTYWNDFPKYGTGGSYKMSKVYTVDEFIKSNFIKMMKKNRKIKFYI